MTLMTRSMSGRGRNEQAHQVGLHSTVYILLEA